MSASTSPECFESYVEQVKYAGATALGALKEFPSQMHVPALIMALVTATKKMADQNEDREFSAYVSLVHEGIDALANDYTERSNKNGN